MLPVQTGKGRQPMGKIAKKPLPPAAAPAEAEDIWGLAMSDFFGFTPRSLSAAAPPAAQEAKSPAPAKPVRKRAAVRGA